MKSTSKFMLGVGGLAAAALLTGASVVPDGTQSPDPAESQAAAASCSVRFDSAAVTSDTDGRWISAQATVSCPTAVTALYTSVQIDGRINGGQPITWQFGNSDTLGVIAQRDCENQLTCTLYVSARAQPGVNTYQLGAGGYYTDTGPFGPIATTQTSVTG